MSGRWITGTAIAIAVSLGGLAQAEQSLTLEQALEMARSANHDLEAARARLEESGASLSAARDALFPVISAQAKATRNNKDLIGKIPVAYSAVGQPIAFGDIVLQKEEELDGIGNVTVPLVQPAAWLNLDAAAKSYQAAGALTKVTEATVLDAAGIAFYAAAGADELLVARHHAVDVAKETLSNARARHEAGYAHPVDVTRAELALVQAEQAVIEAETTQGQAYRALSVVLGRPGPFVAVVGEPDNGAAAEQQRPEILSLERTLAADTANVRAASLRWSPTVSAFGTYHLTNYDNLAGDRYTWAVGVELDFVVFDGGVRDAARRLARAQRREAEADLARERDVAVQELADSRAVLATRNSALTAALKSVELSTEALALVRSQYEAGTAVELDVLQAQDSLVAAEVSLAQARFNLGLARLELRRTSGTL